MIQELQVDVSFMGMNLFNKRKVITVSKDFWK